MNRILQFDAALNKILDALAPCGKTCSQCSGVFHIFQEDVDFYKKLHVPPPKLCPECRKQRRYGFYNNILKFYRKECIIHQEEKQNSCAESCSGTGVISTFPPQSPYKIFDLKYWWSDKWGGEDYGRDYNFEKPFFEQFHELSLTVPHPAITHYWRGVVDSPYTISIIDSKNCYLSSVGASLENVNYSYWVSRAKDSLDSLNIQNCERCYENVYTEKMFNCKFCFDSTECVDSAFLYSCKNCFSCFGCVNLRNKNYCFFNEQLTKEEYLKRANRINLGNRDVLEEYKNEFKKFIKKFPKRNLENDRKNLNSTGDQLEKAKNCHMVFRGSGWTSVENLRYCQDVFDSRDSMDMYIAGPNLSLCYELVEAYDSSNIKFSYFIRDGLDLEYCLECHNCQHCFGCIGLRNKKYHILNKPYSSGDYWRKLDEIKSKALTDGEYGDFFPLLMALHPYNNTYASIEFPLSKEEVLKQGWQWQDDDVSADTSGFETIRASSVPKDIKDVSDDILNKAIICEATGKPFRIVKAELDFYKKSNLPVPTRHPLQRLLERLQKRNPAKLWKAICAKCRKDIHTSYSPENQKEYKIHCEDCYLREVI
jgi:hypothetical protein